MLRVCHQYKIICRVDDFFLMDKEFMQYDIINLLICRTWYLVRDDICNNVACNTVGFIL